MIGIVAAALFVVFFAGAGPVAPVAQAVATSTPAVVAPAATCAAEAEDGEQKACKQAS